MVDITSGNYYWQKQNRIIDPSTLPKWMVSHAAVPLAMPIGKDGIRIYFSPRDANQCSQPAYAVINLNAPERIEEISPEPLLELGPPGAFDDHGVMATDWIEVGGRIYLYYIGWNLGVSVPFRNSIGLAISDDGGLTFTKYSDGPIIDRSPVDPYFTASNCVLQDGGIFRMWYLSCVGWEPVGGKLQHRYHIKYAESSDGIHWVREGMVAIDFANDQEFAISTPRVLKENGRYRMWYSYRGQSYRIGLAESDDGLTWTRKDNLSGIDVSEEGWDSEMIEYPYVFNHNDDSYMLYNGNGYGKTGIGLAILRERLNYG